MCYVVDVLTFSTTLALSLFVYRFRCCALGFITVFIIVVVVLVVVSFRIKEGRVEFHV